MSEIDGIRTGITSSSITVFTTFLSTLLVEDELTTIFAATFSVMLANGISDAFAVGTSLKDGIDLTRDRLLVRDIIVSELIYTFPIVVFVGILAILQRKKHHFFSRHNVKTLRFKLTVLSVVLTYEILGIFLGCTYVSGEDVVDTSIRLAIILGTIGFTGTLTYVMTTYLETGKIKNIGNK